MLPPLSFDLGARFREGAFYDARSLAGAVLEGAHRAVRVRFLASGLRVP
jgi:hypothetical protein